MLANAFFAENTLFGFHTGRVQQDLCLPAPRFV